MIFTVKYRVNKYVICDEDGNLAGSVRRTVSAGNCLDVCDTEGHRRCRIFRGRGELVIEAAEEGNLRCALEYPADEMGRIVQKAYLRPPMAERAVLDMSLGQLAVCQTGKRIFSVRLNGREIGKMTRMLSVSKKVLLPDDFPRECCGLVFAVGFLMLHDDDIQIV